MFFFNGKYYFKIINLFIVVKPIIYTQGIIIIMPKNIFAIIDLLILQYLK